jgi:hypothetical protein
MAQFSGAKNRFLFKYGPVLSFIYCNGYWPVFIEHGELNQYIF